MIIYLEKYELHVIIVSWMWLIVSRLSYIINTIFLRLQIILILARYLLFPRSRSDMHWIIIYLKIILFFLHIGSRCLTVYVSDFLLRLIDRVTSLLKVLVDFLVIVWNSCLPILNVHAIINLWIVPCLRLRFLVLPHYDQMLLMFLFLHYSPTKNLEYSFIGC